MIRGSDSLENRERTSGLTVSWISSHWPLGALLSAASAAPNVLRQSLINKTGFQKTFSTLKYQKKKKKMPPQARR